MLDMELLLFSSSPSQWNSPCCSDQTTGKNPYLSYTITVESSKLNTPKLSKKQISLYQKICDLRFDENLTWKQVADKLNKLGLTEEERTVFYNDTVSNKVGELRYYDPLDGFLKLYDPMKDTTIEFIWDSATSKWKGTGVQSGYTTEVSIEQLTPLAKQDDEDVPDKATTVSRFPS